MGSAASGSVPRVRVAGDRPVRLGKPQGSLSPEPRDQALRRAAREAPDVQVRRDDASRRLPPAAARRASARTPSIVWPKSPSAAISPSLGIWPAGAACAGPGAATKNNASTTTRRRISGHDSDGMPRIYLGLGANLGDREATIRLALARLNAHDGIDVQRVSRLRETDPVGYEDQPRFLNGVARLQTELEPRELLERAARSRARSRPHAPAHASGRGRSISTSFCTTAASSTSGSSIRIRAWPSACSSWSPSPTRPGLEVPGQGPVRALLAALQ